MKSKAQKILLSIVFILAGIYIVALVFVPYATPAVTTAAWIMSVYDHFVSVNAAVRGDAYFYLILIGVLVALYYYLIYKPMHVKGKKSKVQAVSTARLLVFSAVVVYGLLLIILPYITLPVSAVALQPFFDHFSTVKNAIMDDYMFLALTLGALGLGYYFMVYKPKLIK